MYYPPQVGPSADELLIITAADEGDLNFFHELKAHISDYEVLRRRCELAKTFHGMTAIHYAAAKGRIEICKFLIENLLIDINMQDGFGNNPLIYAVMYRHMELVEYLIANGSDINAVNYEGEDAVYWSAKPGNWVLMRSLLTRGANTDSMILKAAGDGDLQFLKELGLQIGEEEFHRKCKTAKDISGKTALHFAAHYGRIEIFEFLIEKVQFDINIEDTGGNSPLLYAVGAGSTSMVDFLITKGANIQLCNSQGFTSLHIAIREGQKELVQFLLQKGANIEGRTSELGTPLECAAIWGRVEFVELLLNHGAKPHTVPPPNVEPPIVGAIKSGSYESVQLLLKAGVDPNKFACGRKSPLGHAAERGDVKIIRALLDYKADPNTIAAGFKPIQLAALGDKHEAVELLYRYTHRIPFIQDWTIRGIIKHHASRLI